MCFLKRLKMFLFVMSSLCVLSVCFSLFTLGGEILMTIRITGIQVPHYWKVDNPNSRFISKSHKNCTPISAMLNSKFGLFDITLLGVTGLIMSLGPTCDLFCSCCMVNILVFVYLCTTCLVHNRHLE